MTKKTIKAPLSYDPGKGRPKEHLAYLNWQEMQELQRINGGNMERGPKGLPSFPPADARGSSSKASSSSKSSSSKSYGGGARDSGQAASKSTSRSTSGGGGGARDSGQAAARSAAGKSSGSSYGGGGRDAGRVASKAAPTRSIGAGGVRSISSGPSVRGPVSRVPSSPRIAPVYSGPPSGFMTPAQQRADRENTLYSPNALSRLYKDIGTFGISDREKRSKIQEQLLGQTIGMSRLGKTVGYQDAPYVKSRGFVDPATSGVVMHWTGSPDTQVPTLGRGRGYGYGVVIDNQGNVVYTKQFNEQGQYPRTFHTAGSYAGENLNTGNIGIANIGIKPTKEQVQAAGVLGSEWFNPSAPVTSHGYLAGDLANQRKLARENRRESSEGKALATAFSSRPNISDIPIASGPPSGAVVAVPASGVTSGIPKPRPKPTTSTQVAGLTPVYQQPYGITYPRPTSATPTEIAQAPSQAGLTKEDEKVIKQELKPAKTAIRGAGFLTGLGLGAPVGIGSGLAYRGYEKSVVNKLNAYKAATPAERDAMERNDPSIIAWAPSIGIQPQNDIGMYNSWAAERGLRGPGESSGGQPRDTQYAGGIGSLPSGTTAMSGTPSTPSTPSTPTSGVRPYEYYQWDVGVNIPSQTDPNYTNYQEYLRRRAAAQTT